MLTKEKRIIGGTSEGTELSGYKKRTECHTTRLFCGIAFSSGGMFPSTKEREHGAEEVGMSLI